MDIDYFRQRLIDLEKTLAGRAGRAVAAARGELIDSAHDAAEAGMADETASGQFAEADFDAGVLKQVRDALARLNGGTFGRCIVDGAPIEAERLAAVPWTPYCLAHQEQLEAAPPAKLRMV